LNRLVVAVVVVAAAPARADETVARDAFRRAQEAAAAQKWREACPLFEASYRADPQIGVLLYLADCHERVGRLATAWGEFHDAAELARARGDAREGVARNRADALAPKLSKIRIVLPPSTPPGFSVKRDGVDVTLLVNGELAVDPGDHELTAAAPGHIEWSKRIAVAGTVTQTIEIPPLDKLPERAAPPPKPPEGKLTITSQRDAAITIDGKPAGTGTYTGTLSAGGHTLRVTAPGMRAYQTEVLVGENGERTIDVPLEAELAAAGPSGPRFELGGSMASGVKLRNDNPVVVTIRAEAALRLGRRVNFGVFAEYGRIETSGACGFDMPGPEPASEFDTGPLHQYRKCHYLMPGLQLYVRVRPGQRLDPYVGIAPGFRFGFASYTRFFGGLMQDRRSDVFPAIVGGIRGGVDYRLTPDKPWILGAFVESSVTVFGQESSIEPHQSGVTFLSLFGGVRTTYAF
jgi:hypothetical protein